MVTAGKGLTSSLLFVVFNCVLVTLGCGILGQVWYLIVSIPDLCHLSYFNQTFKSILNLAIMCTVHHVCHFHREGNGKIGSRVSFEH